MRQAVLVHGLWLRGWSMKLLARRLRRYGVQAHRFSYATTRASLDAHADALHHFVQGLIQPNEAGQLDLLGYSMGGLVVLRMLQRHAGLPPGRIVLLGTPVQGSSAARWAAEKRLLRPLLGQAANALDAGLFLQAPEGRATGVIAGTRALGLGRISGQHEGSGDGTVSVEETRLQGAAMVQIRASHSGLLVSAQAAELAAQFLLHGRFEG